MSDLERQLRAYATSVVRQSEPVAVEGALLADATPSVTRQRGPLAAALAFAFVVLVGIVAWLASQQPTEVIDSPDLTTPTDSVTTTVPATSTSVPGDAGDTPAGVVIGDAEVAGWAWVPVDDRIGAAAPNGGASSVLGQLEDGTLVGLSAHGGNYNGDWVRGSPFLCQACSLLFFDGSAWREQTLPQFDDLLLDDLWVQEGLLWAWVQVDRPVSPFERALFVSDDGREWDETDFDWSGFKDPAPRDWSMLRLGDTVVAIESEVQSTDALVTGSRSEVFVSSDRGRSFTKLTSFPADEALSVRRAWTANSMFHMVILSEQGNMVLVGSRDGMTWTGLGDVSGLPGSGGTIEHLMPGPLALASPTDELVAVSIWWSATGDALQRSEDGGFTWFNVGVPLGDPEVYAANGWIYAAARCPIPCPDREVLVSRNGLTWLALMSVDYLEPLGHPFVAGAIIRETAEGLEVALPPAR